jgi:hypothetical protein
MDTTEVPGLFSPAARSYFRGLKMVVLLDALDRIGGNGARAFQCMACRGLITHSDRLLPVRGLSRHLFTNPTGLECDLYTFDCCPGTIALGEATEDHTFFQGYSWRMAFCCHCGQHLGWHYQGTVRSRRPYEFWGILVPRLVTE